MSQRTHIKVKFPKTTGPTTRSAPIGNNGERQEQTATKSRIYGQGRVTNEFCTHNN